MTQNEIAELCLTLDDQSSPEMYNELSALLDHAVVRKTEVRFENATLVLVLKRNLYGSRKKKFLFWNIWLIGRYPTTPCQLSIQNVEECEIRDEDKGTGKDEITIGGVSIKDKRIYIGAFCECENRYGITLRVSKIKIELKDIKAAQLGKD